ncbi:tyrosine-type recombinase/integrase [Mesorhizobium marinum]|uniref:Tyrosine-type recombinase/integrase n=1 Tax=Mesorhizobium marinum TaxID=3228790 RepID=A0ABV3R0J0_9HYPH
MSIRKRRWINGSGNEKEAWVVDYVDAKGKRRLKTFGRKKDADAFRDQAGVEIRQGIHVADSQSVKLSVAGELWIRGTEEDGLERASVAAYRSHLDLHMKPFLGNERLSDLNVPALRSFEDMLRDNGRSPAMVRRVMVSLGTLLADAQERGLVTRNVVRDLRGRRRRGERLDKRHKGKLKVGVDIPTRDEIRAIVQAAAGRWRPLLLTAIFTGLRASELRGLRWEDVDLDRRDLSVRQRADRFNAIGKPKSVSGERSVPLPPMIVNTLREWKLRCPRGQLDLVFPNGSGNIEGLSNIIRRGLIPTQIAAGVTTVGADGNKAAKYTGMHALRHFYASWSINRQQDGGLGLPPKMVQERMGHSTIVLTMDRYGHLFPRGDDAEEMAAAERALLS